MKISTLLKRSAYIAGFSTILLFANQAVYSISCAPDCCVAYHSCKYKHGAQCASCGDPNEGKCLEKPDCRHPPEVGQKIQTKIENLRR